MRHFITALLFIINPLQADEPPAHCRQLILGLASDWNSSHVSLSLYEKNAQQWKINIAPWPGRLGKRGLAWGLGLHTNPKNATTKTEGDMRTPAGLFRIGGAWGYAAKISRLPALPYRQVTPHDLWIEDPSSQSYNRNIILDHDPATPWEKKQQMKQNDAAHALKLFIGHNASPRPIAGAGSSIFFHIWRSDGTKPSAGCTTMAPDKLRTLVSRIDPALQPCYLILPQSEFEKIRALWNLP